MPQFIGTLLKYDGNGLLSMGTARSHSAALAFSMAGIRNDEAADLRLVFDTK